jgi:hypothetical protein
MVKWQSAAVLCLTLLKGMTAVWLTLGGFFVITIFLISYSYVIYNKKTY